MRNLIPLVLIVYVLFSTSCRRDRGPQPRPPVHPQPYTFVDEFDDDRNKWSFADAANFAYGVVQNGVFSFDYNDDLYEAYYVSKDIGFNRYNDFTIYTRIGSNNNMGLLFGYNDNQNSYGYSFMIDYDGYFALYDEGGNGYGMEITPLVESQTNRYVYGNGEFNEIRLEQRGNRWIGYINDYQVFNIEAQPLKGASVGFVNVSLTQGDADYLQVDWLQ